MVRRLLRRVPLGLALTLARRGCCARCLGPQLREPRPPRRARGRRPTFRGSIGRVQRPRSSRPTAGTAWPGPDQHDRRGRGGGLRRVRAPRRYRRARRHRSARPAVTEASSSAPWARSGWRSTARSSNHLSCSTMPRCAPPSRRDSLRSKPARSTPRSGWAARRAGVPRAFGLDLRYRRPSSRTQSRSSEARVPRRRSPSRSRRSRSSLTGATRIVLQAQKAATSVGKAVIVKGAGGRWKIPAAKVRSWITFATAPGGALQPVIDETAIPKALARRRRRTLPGTPISAQYLRSKSGSIFGVIAGTTAESSIRRRRPPRSSQNWNDAPAARPQGQSRWRSPAGNRN